MKITDKQKTILEAIRELTIKNGISPTLNELKEYLGYSNTSSVQRHTDALKDKGILTTTEGKFRSLKINQKLQKVVNIPLVGAVACGNPSLAIEDIEAYIPVQSDKIKGELNNYFFLRAVGDSMNKADIEDGDFLLVKKQNSGEPGDKVVALIGDEATVKFLKKTNGQYLLEPKSDNPIHKPIYINDDVTIQGIVKDVIKK